MPAVKTNVTIEQGTSWSHGWGVTYQGSPIDPTWVARSQMRKTAKAPEVLHEFAAEVVMVTIPGENGEPDRTISAAVMAVDPAESSAWTWVPPSTTKVGVYDFEVVSPDGAVVLRVSQGDVKVSPEVTR